MTRFVMDKLLESLDVNNYIAVENWFEQFDLLMLTNDRINDNNKVAFLLAYIGKTAYALLKELAYPHTPNTLMVANIRHIVDHVKPRHETHERAIFNSFICKVDQSVNSYYCFKNRPRNVILVIN